MKIRLLLIVAITMVFALSLCGCGRQEMNNDISSNTSSFASSETASLSSQTSSSADVPTEISSAVSVQASLDTSSTIRYTKWKSLKTEYVVKVGETEMIQLSVPKNEYAKTVKVAWKISDESIATFAEEHNNWYFCKVVGLKPGEITIGGEVTAPDGDGTVSCKVIVEE